MLAANTKVKSHHVSQIKWSVSPCQPMGCHFCNLWIHPLSFHLQVGNLGPRETQGHALGHRARRKETSNQAQSIFLISLPFPRQGWSRGLETTLGVWLPLRWGTGAPSHHLPPEVTQQSLLGPVGI